MKSILTSIKKLMGIDEAYKHFDTDLIIHINTVFAVLTQLGVGPSSGFSIKDENDTWDSYIQNDTLLEAIKTYVYLKVKLLFDPPASTTMSDAMDRTISELEWRFHLSADCKQEEGS